MSIDRRLREPLQKTEALKIPDLNFKPNPVHLTIMKAAKRNGGYYDRRDAIKKIRESDNPEKLKRQRILWNKVNLEKLVSAGYMEKIDDNVFRANPLAYGANKREFEPGKNHIKLLQKNTDGMIKTIDLKKQLSNLSPEKQKREKSFIDGMVKKLYENGYLERVEKGQYKITEKGNSLMNGNRKILQPAGKVKENNKGFNITAFDRNIKDIIKEMKIDVELLNNHPKRVSLEKRIITLQKNNMILSDGTVTEQFLQELERVLKLSKNKMLTIDNLNQEQLRLIKDLRLFQNLSKEQIVKHIFGDDRKLSEENLKFLIKKKVIRRDEDTGICILDKVGIDFSNQLYPDAVKYHTKLYSRKEEMEHDMLVYTAYKAWEKRIMDAGGIIVDIKNDRQLRSDDGKKYGRMIGAYPDLRVVYKMPRMQYTLNYDIEVDCGYDEKTVRSKMHGLVGNLTNANLGWYCKTLYQAAKVANILTKDTTKARKVYTARKITVYYMGKDGKVHEVRY